MDSSGQSRKCVRDRSWCGSSFPQQPRRRLQFTSAQSIGSLLLDSLSVLRPLAASPFAVLDRTPFSREFVELQTICKFACQPHARVRLSCGGLTWSAITFKLLQCFALQFTHTAFPLRHCSHCRGFATQLPVLLCWRLQVTHILPSSENYCIQPPCASSKPMTIRRCNCSRLYLRPS